MTEKWIVDDAGTLINMVTRNHYDYVEEVVDVLNKLSEENEQLKKDLKKKFVPFAKADGDYTAVNTEEFIKILNENEQLKQEVENLHEQLTHFLGDSDD